MHGIELGAQQNGLKRADLIAARVNAARSGVEREAERKRAELVADYTARGLGKSQRLLRRILSTLLEAVKEVLWAHVDAEKTYPPPKDEEDSALDASLQDLRSLARAEIGRVQGRIAGHAKSMGLKGVLSREIRLEEKRLLAFFEQRLRDVATERSLCRSS